MTAKRTTQFIIIVSIIAFVSGCGNQLISSGSKLTSPDGKFHYSVGMMDDTLYEIPALSPVGFAILALGLGLAAVFLESFFQIGFV